MRLGLREGVGGKMQWLRSFVAKNAPQDDNVLLLSLKHEVSDVSWSTARNGCATRDILIL